MNILRFKPKCHIKYYIKLNTNIQRILPDHFLRGYFVEVLQVTVVSLRLRALILTFDCQLKVLAGSSMLGIASTALLRRNYILGSL